jgi:selenocysteine-specific elongation factor
MTDNSYFTLATAGHVDHGKTSLLKALTGIDPDRLKEEKERGMTTDLGFAHLKLPDGLVIGLIDVPGHGKFLKNMLAGVGGIELSLLVVAADEGPMPQTLEHVRILGLLGIKAALVAVTKIDLVDEELAQIVEQQTRELLAEEGIEIMDVVPVSSVTGAGLERLKTVLAESLRKLTARSRSGAAFLPVDRVFSKTGFGTVITGTLVRGGLQVGEQVFLEPGGISARVRRLETFGLSLEKANAGQRLACNLVVKDDAALSRGHVVLGEPLAPTNLLLVHLVRLPESFKSSEIENLSGQPVRFYHGTAECHGRIRWIEPISREQDCSLRRGAEAMAALGLFDPAVAEAQDRFVVRLSDDAIYGGTIAMRDQPRWLTRAKIKESFQLFLKGDFAAAAVAYVQASPQKMVHYGQLDKLLPTSVRSETVNRLVGAGLLVRLGDLLLPKAFHAELRQKALNEIARFVKEKETAHEKPFMPLENLKVKVMPVAERSAFQALVQELEESGAVVRQADKLTLKGKDVVASSPAQDALCNEIERILSEHLCLEIEEIAKQSRRSSKEVKAALEQMVRSSRAALVDYEFAASSQTILKAHRVIAKLWQEKKQISPSEFKEGLGTTRKYAMALLAYFDDRKITRRLAEGRALLVLPADLS